MLVMLVIPDDPEIFVMLGEVGEMATLAITGVGGDVMAERAKAGERTGGGNPGCVVATRRSAGDLDERGLRRLAR